MKFHENPWENTRFYEIAWDSMRFHENTWDFIKICRITLELACISLYVQGHVFADIWNWAACSDWLRTQWATNNKTWAISGNALVVANKHSVNLCELGIFPIYFKAITIIMELVNRAFMECKENQHSWIQNIYYCFLFCCKKPNIVKYIKFWR